VTTRLRQLARATGVVAIVLACASCASDAPQDTLEPEGPLARTIDGLWNEVIIVAIVVFFLVQGLILFAILKFRRKGDDDDEMPSQMHGNTRLELGWTILPVLVLGVVSVRTLPVVFDVFEQPDNALEVEVTGQKYWWAYSYPEQSDHGVDDAFVTANELHIPAGEDVNLSLRSRDVIHSFWAPKLNGKRDVVPGRVHQWRISADHAGVYSGQCAEFCGTSHANMRLKVVAHDPESWDDWLSVMQNQPDAPTAGSAAQGNELFVARGCSGCHQVAGQHEEVADTSPPAPDLTHFMTRDCFAGCIYEQTRNEVEAWLRNPQRKAGSLMVIGDLSEPEIDDLYAYLETLE
jgi:cytochrome c oxidase subunit II